MCDPEWEEEWLGQEWKAKGVLGEAAALCS